MEEVEMKYVLLFVGTMDDQERFDNMSAEEMAAGMKLAEQWFEEYSRAGKIVGGEQLKGPRRRPRFDTRTASPSSPTARSSSPKRSSGALPSCRSRISTRHSRWPRHGAPGLSRSGPLWNDEGLTETRKATDAALTAVFREEAAKLTGAMVRLIGNFDIAEEVVQDSLVAALENWPAQGIPDNPGA